MLDAIGTALATFAKDHPIISLVLISISALEYAQILFGKFVTFTHKMRLHWRRLRSEPDPHLVNN